MSDRTEVVLFDDGVDLAPLTCLRAPFEVRTGAFSILERMTREGSPMNLAGLWARRELAPLVAERTGLPTNDAARLPGSPVLVLNGRLAEVPSEVRRLAPGEGLEAPCGSIVAALLAPAAARRFLEEGHPASVIDSMAACDAPLLTRPWDVIRHRDRTIQRDIAAVIGSGDTFGDHGMTVVGGNPVRCDPSATVMPGAVLDATIGSIVIEHGVTIRPNAVVTGPCFIGRRSIVLDGAVIRAGTSIGPMCKVNGEMAGVIFQGFANKSHDGFLGDSWVGEWSNLGAGTITSNLLNTYGEIVVSSPDGEGRERTGLRFLGSIIGDHAKTAIGTRLMTGSVIGVGAMIATDGPAPTSIGNFAWLAGGRTQLYRLSKFLDVASYVMSRRHATMGEAERARLRLLHERETSQLIAPPLDYQI